MSFPAWQHKEPHPTASTARTNWLRASVLGANDGIVSIASLVVGVAGAIESSGPVIIAGIAGLLAGALSMAAGEYVSVSSQRDTEMALMAKERRELKENPEGELQELAGLYEKKGLSKETALTVARELTAHDVFAAHADAELNIDPQNLTNPWHAAVASALSFTAGGIIPLVAITLPAVNYRVGVTFLSVAFALMITGLLSAFVSGARPLLVAARVVFGGLIAMLVTYGIGTIFGVAGI